MPVGGDILVARFWCTSGDQAAVNVRFWKVDTHTGNGFSLQTFADNLDNVSASRFKALLSTSATYRGVAVQRVWPFPPTVQAFSIANAGQGTVTGDVQPKQVCGLVNIRTPFAGRKYRGRLYVPFPAKASSDAAGVPIAAYVTALNTLHQTIQYSATQGTNPDTGVIIPCLPTRVLVPGSDPPKYVLNGQHTPITVCTSRALWATQRRRGSFGRQNVSPI